MHLIPLVVVCLEYRRLNINDKEDNKSEDNEEEYIDYKGTCQDPDSVARLLAQPVNKIIF